MTRISSMRDERMTDRTEEEVGMASTDEPSSLDAVPRRRVWPVLLLLVVLVAAGGWFAYREATAPEPLRVLIAVEIDGAWWEGSRPAALFTDEAADLLTKLGFDPVRAGDPETARILEEAASPREAARALGAAFVITGRLEPATSELPVDEGFFEVTIDASVQIEPTVDGGVLATSAIHTFSGAKDRDRAIGLAAQSAARHLVDDAAPALASHPDVAALLDGKDAKRLDQLAPLKTYVVARQATLEDAEKGYAALDRARRDEEARGPLTFHSPRDADDRLVAVVDGEVLVATADVHPFFSASGLELLRSEALETLGWRPLGGEPGPFTRRLWRGYNAFTYPSASGDGQRIALVEDLYGWARSLVVVDRGKPARRLRTESTRRLSEPRLAPDGAHVAFIDRACRRCAKELRVVDAETGEERLHVGEEEAIDGFAWLDRARLMVVMDPQDGAPGLWAFQIASGDDSSLMGVEGSGVLRDPVASPDGRLVAASNPTARTIVTLDMESNEVTEHLVAGAATALSFSADGRRLAFELQTPDSRHAEIAILTLDGSEVTLLTSNDAADRYPLFSSDGTRVFFEARDPDPVFGKRRAVARIASVPVP